MWEQGECAAYIITLSSVRHINTITRGVQETSSIHNITLTQGHRTVLSYINGITINWKGFVRPSLAHLLENGLVNGYGQP